MISGMHVREALQLNRTGFIDFALLLGTDFSQRIKNISSSRALKFICKHGSIDCIVKAEQQILGPLYLEQVGLARLVFDTLPPVPDEALLQLKACDDAAVAVISNRCTRK